MIEHAPTKAKTPSAVATNADLQTLCETCAGIPTSDVAARNQATSRTRSKIETLINQAKTEGDLSDLNIFLGTLVQSGLIPVGITISVFQKKIATKIRTLKPDQRSSPLGMTGSATLATATA
jgi:hypothetical protein